MNLHEVSRSNQKYHLNALVIPIPLLETSTDTGNKIKDYQEKKT